MRQRTVSVLACPPASGLPGLPGHEASYASGTDPLCPHTPCCSLAGYAKTNSTHCDPCTGNTVAPVTAMGEQAGGHALLPLSRMRTPLTLQPSSSALGACGRFTPPCLLPPLPSSTADDCVACPVGSVADGTHTECNPW